MQHKLLLFLDAVCLVLALVSVLLAIGFDKLNPWLHAFSIPIWLGIYGALTAAFFIYQITGVAHKSLSPWFLLPLGICVVVANITMLLFVCIRYHRLTRINSNLVPRDSSDYHIIDTVREFIYGEQFRFNCRLLETSGEKIIRCDQISRLQNFLQIPSDENLRLCSKTELELTGGYVRAPGAVELLCSTALGTLQDWARVTALLISFFSTSLTIIILQLVYTSVLMRRHRPRLLK
jgi:hypothetical protein